MVVATNDEMEQPRLHGLVKNNVLVLRVLKLASIESGMSKVHNISLNKSCRDTHLAVANTEGYAMW